jgi:hypothetical protein
MTDTPMAVEVNCATGEEIIRPLTAEEIAQRDANAVKFAEEQIAREAEAQAKADARLAAQAKLEALGLTGEEVAALTNEVTTKNNVVINEDLARLLDM